MADAATPDVTSPPRGPRRPFLVWVVRIISFASAAAAILMFAASLTLMIVGNNLKIASYVVLSYVCLFALLATLVEIDFMPQLRGHLFSKSFIFRGLFYVFIGVLLLSTDQNLDASNAYDSFIKGASWVLMSAGMVYFLMGLLFIDRMYHKHLEGYQTAKNDAAAPAAASHA